MVELKETETVSQAENDISQPLQESSDISKTDQETEQTPPTMSEDNPEHGTGESTDSTNDTIQKSTAHPVPSECCDIVSLSTKLIACRSIFYVVVLFVLIRSNLSGFVQMTGSFGLVCIAIASSYFLVYVNDVSALLKKYIVISNAVIDLGIIMLLLFINAGTSSSLLLGFPLVTFMYGIFSNTFQIAVISGLSIFFNWLVCLALGYQESIQFNFSTGILVHGAVLCWIMGIHKIMMRVRENSHIKHRLFSLYTKLLDSFPHTLAKKIMRILQFQKIDSLEYEFRKKYELLIRIINEKTMEIEKLKVRLENEGYGDDGEEDFSNAVLEINNLMEIENLTLRTENEKLDQLVHGLEERITTLTQEMETLNSELERTYKSQDLQNNQTEPHDTSAEVVDAAVS